MTKTELHEDLIRSDKVESGSNRSFGIVFAVVFLIVGLLPLIDGGLLRWWAVIITAVLAVVALAAPQLLAPFNRLWFLFGLKLHKIVSPIIMALLFYLTVTPTALIMLIVGKRPLPLLFDKSTTSYWIKRDPPGPAPQTMKRQF